MNIAVENFEKGYNCAQAVFLEHAEKFGLDKDMALKLSSSFGGGMGRLREVCGAVTAMFAIAGLKVGYVNPNDDIAKKKHYEFIQFLAEKFKETHKTIICRELLGEGYDDKPIPEKRTQEYYASRPCSKCIKTASEIIAKYIIKD